MDEENILAIYERVSRVSRQMLDAARTSQWDRLTALEKDCSALFATLFEHDGNPPRSAAYRARKAELIRGLLDDDAQIRLLVEPRLAALGELLGATRRERQLVQAYQL